MHHYLGDFSHLESRYSIGDDRSLPNQRVINTSELESQFIQHQLDYTIIWLELRCVFAHIAPPVVACQVIPHPRCPICISAKFRIVSVTRWAPASPVKIWSPWSISPVPITALLFQTDPTPEVHKPEHKVICFLIWDFSKDCIPSPGSTGTHSSWPYHLGFWWPVTLSVCTEKVQSLSHFSLSKIE